MKPFDIGMEGYLSRVEFAGNPRRKIEIPDGKINQVGKGIKRFKPTGSISDNTDYSIDAFSGGVSQF